jgi:hypothetical protein
MRECLNDPKKPFFWYVLGLYPNKYGRKQLLNL